MFIFDLVVHLHCCNRRQNRGWNSFAFTLSWFSLVPFVNFWSHRSSNRYKCWTARSRYNLPTLSLVALVILMHPCKSWWAIPVFQCALLFLSPYLITTSPSFNCSSIELCRKLCCSLKPLRYSFVQRDHIQSLQERMNLARFFRSISSEMSTSPSSPKFGCQRIIKFSVRIGVWMSSSIYPSGWLLSVISISNRTLSSSFHVNFALPLAFNKACLVNAMIFSNWPPHQGAWLRLNHNLMWCCSRNSRIFSSSKITLSHFESATNIKKLSE